MAAITVDGKPVLVLKNETKVGKVQMEMGMEEYLHKMKEVKEEISLNKSLGLEVEPLS